MLMYLAYNLAHMSIEVVPRPICIWIARRIADACFFLDRRGRDAVIFNISHVLACTGHNTTSVNGKREVRRLARETFKNFAVHIVDFMRIERAGSDLRTGLIRVEHFDRFQEILSRGRGLISVTAHVGNWEMGAAVVASMGYPISAITMRLKDGRVNDFFARLRSRGGIRVVLLGEAARASFRALKRNEIVAFVADRDVNESGTLIKFFGRYIRIPRGPAEIAARSDAPVVPAFLIQEEDGRFRWIAERPIVVDEGLPMDEKVKGIEEAMVRELEKYISRYPTQWFAFYRVWN
jgi:KDO2-lipid IV(A) lauroyltransferase